MHASLSSSSRTCACAFGSSNRRSSGGFVRVVDLDDARHRLLLEPLPRVARRDARAAGQLGGRHRPRARERLVEAEPDSQLDVRELHRRQARAEQPPGELLDLRLVGSRSTRSRPRFLLLESALPVGGDVLGDGDTS